MEKPKPKVIITALNYLDCVKWIESKYKISLRDFAGKFKNIKDNKPNDVPYQDFWRWVIGINIGIHNGSRFYLSIYPEDIKEEEEKWVRDILQMFKAEFEEYADEGILTFWVEW
jgi:hypothetical protein